MKSVSTKEDKILGIKAGISYRNKTFISHRLKKREKNLKKKMTFQKTKVNFLRCHSVEVFATLTSFSSLMLG